MSFNPDEYLKESNSFNPDEYLSETPTTTSALAAGAKSAVSGTIPAVGGMLGAAGLLGGVTLATGGVGTLPALGLMLAGGMGGSYVAGKAQEHLIEPNIPEDFKASMGFDPALRAKETEEHPYASFAGQLAPNLAFFRPGKLADIALDSGKVIGSGTQRAMGAAIGGGIDAGQQLYDKGTIDPTQLAMSMAFQAVAAKPTALGKMMMPGNEAIAPKEKAPKIFEGTEPEAIQHATDAKLYSVQQIEGVKGRIATLEKVLENLPEDHPDHMKVREKILVEKDYMKEQTMLRDKMDEFLESKLPPDQRRAAQPIDKEALLKEYTELGQKRHAPNDTNGMIRTLDRQTDIAEILKKHAEATKEVPVEAPTEPVVGSTVPTEGVAIPPVDTQAPVAPTNRFDIASDFTNSLSTLSDNQIRKAIWTKEQRLSGMGEELSSFVQGEIEAAKQELATRAEARKVDPMYSVNPEGEVLTAEPLSRQLQVDVKMNNLLSALQHVADHPTTSRPLKAVAKFLLTNKNIGKYSRLYYDSTLSAVDKHGAQRPVEMGVTQGTVDVRVRNENAVSPIGMVHEAIHAATSGMMQAFGHDIHMPHHIKTAIKQVNKLHEDLLGSHYNNIVKYLMEKMPMSEQQKAIELRDPTKNQEYYAREQADIYLSNPRELLAYGLTDSVFRPILNKIEVGGKSVYSSFVDSVAAMFGWTGKQKRTALEALTESADTLISESTGDVYTNDKGEKYNTPAGVDPIYGFRDNKGDIGYEATNRYVNAIANMGNNIAKRMLSPAAFAKFWPNQELIYKVSDMAMTADRNSEFRRARLLGGTNARAVLEKLPLLHKMSKQVNDDGALGAMAAITDKQMGEMMPEIIQAFRDGVNMTPDVHPTWTPQQKNMAKVLMSIVDQMHTMTNESLRIRGLRPIAKREGYFPNVHIGDHYVDMHLNGVPVRREWFISKQEAQNKVDAVTKNGGDFKAIAGEREPGADYTSIAETMQEVIDKANETGVSVKELLNAKIDTLNAKADSVGSHQQHRGFMRGFMGDESAFGVEKNGTRFKKAIETWIQEYTESLRRRELSLDTAEYMTSVESQQTRIDQPNAYKVARYFLDNELGILKSPYKGQINKMTNAIVDDAFARMFPGVKLTDHVLSHVWNQMSRAGYNMVLTSAPAVWITQTLGFIQMGRGMFKEGSINPLTVASSASKGLFKVMFNQYSDDMLNGLLHVAQNTDTFDKHMTNEVTSFIANQDKAHITNRLREWLSGEKFTTAADSFSRVVAWSMAYEHMVASGYKGRDAWMLAAEMTDDNLIRFGKKNLPGMYKELGSVGSIISPLKNYISGQVSNLAVDVKGVAQGAVRSVENRTIDRRMLGDTMALTMNALGMIMLGGLISAPIITDYEYLRQQLVKWGMISYDALPDWTKFSASFGDVAHRGAIALTGIDMGASMRYQSMLKSGVDTTSNGISGISMPLSVTAKALSGATTVAKNFVGGGVPDAQFDEAIKGIVPRGIPSGIADTIINSNREKETRGQRGNALTDSGPTEKIARFLGSKSVEQANQTEALNVLDLKNKSMIPIKQKMVDLILSEGAGDRERGLDMARKYIAKGEMTPDDLKTMLLNQALAKKKDMLLSKFTNKQGQMTTPSQVRNLKEIKDMLYNK